VVKVAGDGRAEVEFEVEVAGAAAVAFSRVFAAQTLWKQQNVYCRCLVVAMRLWVQAGCVSQFNPWPVPVKQMFVV
jgi:hypothetical protein